MQFDWKRCQVYTSGQDPSYCQEDRGSYFAPCNNIPSPSYAIGLVTSFYIFLIAEKVFRYVFRTNDCRSHKNTMTCLRLLCVVVVA